MTKYKIKAHVEILGIVAEYDTEITHESSEYPTYAIREVKDELHRRAKKKYKKLPQHGTLVELTEVIVSDIDNKDLFT